MPSSTDEAFHPEDTPDEVKGNKQARKKQKKKAAKQTVPDDSCKDSSSEGPRLSPELAPTLNPPAPSPPPSQSPSPSLVPQLANPVPDFSLLDNAASPLSKPALLQSANQQLRPFPLTSEPSPPQDGIFLGQDGAKVASRLPYAGSPTLGPSLSSSPQGGIRLPSNMPFTRPLIAPVAAKNHTPKSRPPWESPPLPHMPQRHFSRLAEYDFSKHVPPRMMPVFPGTRGYFCGFDSWQLHRGTSIEGFNTAVLVGWEGGLDIYRQYRQKTEILGRLEGLQGSVIDAKVLPWTDRHDPLDHLRPLVACVIHGPVLGSPSPSGNANPSDQANLSLSDATIKEYQTVVEVYSMRTLKRVSRLFQTQTEQIHQPVTTQGFIPPSPIGNLGISAAGKFVVVTSGISGEVYVFAPRRQVLAEEQDPFCCLGKFWTSVKTRTEAKHKSAPSDPGCHRQKNVKRPVFALSHRWLAIKPPLVSSSQMTLKGWTETIGHVDPAGISSHASPAPPSPNCEVDAPYNDSLFSRFTKQATQELYKGAQHGFQALKNYVNRPATATGDPAYYGSSQSPQHDQAIFPPTHAQSNEAQASPIEPALVSIIDLNKLLEREELRSKGAVAALATFPLNDGCSFLSFSPNGLSLLATNHVGDESRVWDLTRVADARAASEDPAAVGTIRMISRFHRVSPSVVIDVVWTSCGNRVAILTDRGTVHLYGLQSSEYKPLATLQSAVPSPGSSPRDEAQAGGFLSNVRAGWQSIHGLAKKTQQGGSGGIVSTLGNASAAARYAGGRAVRQGFSKGLGIAAEGAHNIRHAEDNKIRLRPSQHLVAPGCVQWIEGKEKDIIATVSDGRITLLAVRNVSHTQNRKTVVTPAVSKHPIGEMSLQPISNDVLPPGVLGVLDAQGPHGSCAKEGTHGFCYWDQASMRRRASNANDYKKVSLAQVQDKETNPPYMPFHRLPQVNLFTISPCSSEAGGADGGDGWAFGMPLAASSKVNCQQSRAEEAYLGVGEGEMEGLVGKMDETLRAREAEEEQVVDM